MAPMSGLRSLRVPVSTRMRAGACATEPIHRPLTTAQRPALASKKPRTLGRAALVRTRTPFG